MEIAVGITTCNEEQTIGPLLAALQASQGDHFRITQIIVVSAACRDRTDEIIKTAAARDPRIVLIPEPVRRGKSAAVNTFLQARRPSDLTFLFSGDVLPASDFVARVAAAFQDPNVGMAGGRPVPVNSPRTLTGQMGALLWDMHHDIALSTPKLGEAIAFRSPVVQEIPPSSAVDEASIEALVLAADLRLAYVPDAILSNRSPDTLREWLSQRRRIAYGHAWLQQKDGHAVSTGDSGKVAQVLTTHLRRHPSLLPAAVILVGIEAMARLLARRDLAQHSDRHAIWDIAPSTKSFREQ